MFQLESHTKDSFPGTRVQPKLKIGHPGDKYEQEADAVADRVMTLNQNETMQMQPVEEEEEVMQPKLRMQPLEREEVQIQMKCEECEEEEMLQTKSETGGGYASPFISQHIQISKGNGIALTSNTNQLMSNAFGADFSKVKVHTDTNSVEMNQKLGARAFTHGNDIYFSNGEYSPESSTGKRLLAHELTHVVQQSASTNPNPSIQADFWDTVGRGWDLYWNLDDEGATYARDLMEHYAVGLGTDFDVFPSDSSWNYFMLGRPEIQRAMRPVLERVAINVAANGPTDQPWIRFGEGPTVDETITGVRLNELESMRLTLHGCHRIEVHILYDVNAIAGGHEVIFRQIRMKWVDVGDMHPGTGTELNSGEIVDDSELTSAGSSYNIFIEFMPFERTVYHVTGGSATQISGWPPTPGVAEPGNRG